MTVDFVDVFKTLYSEKEIIFLSFFFSASFVLLFFFFFFKQDALKYAQSFLFDIAHIAGKSDANRFSTHTGLDNFCSRFSNFYVFFSMIYFPIRIIIHNNKVLVLCILLSLVGHLLKYLIMFMISMIFHFTLFIIILLKPILG